MTFDYPVALTMRVANRHRRPAATVGVAFLTAVYFVASREVANAGFGVSPAWLIPITTLVSSRLATLRLLGFPPARDWSAIDRPACVARWILGIAASSVLCATIVTLLGTDSPTILYRSLAGELIGTLATFAVAGRWISRRLARRAMARVAPRPLDSRPDPSRPRIGIISGFYPGRRFNSNVNHSAYAAKHGYYYIDASAPGSDPRAYFRKLEMVGAYLELFDWIFWLDDDAYFTNFDTRLHDILSHAESGHDLLICGSPTTKTTFTRFSSGQFFLRRSARSQDFLQACRSVDLEDVRRSFWTEAHGFFTGGDQDAMVYVSETDPRFGGEFMRILPHELFNSRDYEYSKSLSEHFLVHFTGRHKSRSKRRFCRRLGVNAFLVPDVILTSVATDPLETTP